MKTILYISSTLPLDLYTKFINNDDKTDQQAQKFNRSVMDGFIQNGVSVYAISYRKNFLGKEDSFVENDINYSIVHASNNVKVICEVKKYVKKLLKQFPDAKIFCDVLNISVSMGALFTAFGKNCIGIITDVPGIYNSGINAFINRQLIKLYSGYVFLTLPMNVLLNRKNKPFIVMEGVYCNQYEDACVQSEKNEYFDVLYAGSMHKKYGINQLLNAFLMISDDKIRLHLYGDGDYVEEIKKVSNNKKIFYYGIKDNKEVVDAEKRASLLVNPRSKKELFTQYSFPSKTIEYMSTGTPVLMQELPGMPEEYKDYVYLYDGETDSSLLEMILLLKGKSDEELITKGKNARDFIVSNKNSKNQIKQIILKFTV